MGANKSLQSRSKEDATSWVLPWGASWQNEGIFIPRVLFLHFASLWLSICLLAEWKGAHHSWEFEACVLHWLFERSSELSAIVACQVDNEDCMFNRWHKCPLHQRRWTLTKRAGFRHWAREIRECSTVCQWQSLSGGLLRHRSNYGKFALSILKQLNVRHFIRKQRARWAQKFKWTGTKTKQ